MSPKHLRPRIRRALATVVATVLLATGVTVGATSTAAPAQATSATTTTCGFATAGTGTFASALCWFDLSGYSAAQAAAGQTFSVAIPGGYTLTLTLTVSGGPVAAHTFPTYSGAYLGNSGHYSGVPGKPALYQTSNGTTTTATVGSISLVDRTGRVQTGWALVGADAESTDNSESITWTSSAPLTSLTASGSSTGLGNACAGGFTGVGTTSVTCTGLWVGQKTGTAILAAHDPSTFSQTMVGGGGGLQAISFGVLLSSVQLTTKIVNGFAGDGFSYSVQDSDATVLASGATTGGSSAGSGPLTVIVDASGSTFDLSQQITAGLASNYTTTWACTRNGQADASLPAGTAGDSANVLVGIGDSVACTITNTAKAATLTVVKHAGTPVDVNGNGLTDAGDTIPYSFTVTNTGALTLGGVAVTDAKVGAVTCPVTTLVPGAATTCTASYTVTAADVTAGSVVNTATASGYPPGVSNPVTSAPSSTTTPTQAAAPSITLVKSAVPATVDAVGEVITYSFVVTNSGNVTLHGVALAEGTFTGSGPFGAIICPPGTGTLLPGAQVTCTASYTVTQADVDAGARLSNTATATGVPPAGAAVTSTSTSVVPLPVQSPSVSLRKTVSPTTATGAGQTLHYSFAITNTGNISLDAPSVSETSFTGHGAAPTVDCPASTLLPGQIATCTASYTVTQADVDAGSVHNTATGHAVAFTVPHAPTVDSSPSSAAVTIPAAPALTLTKTASVAASAMAGSAVQYSFTLTNTGNVTLTGPSVAETAFTGAGALGTPTCPSTPLPPGGTAVCTVTYTLTQADVDTGTVENSAVAHATGPGGTQVVSATSSASVTPTRTAALGLVKTADPTTISAIGETVTYGFRITNAGTVTLRSPTVTEASFSGTGGTPSVTCPPAAVLAPGAAVTCTATYTVTQADLDAGRIANTATATATPPAGMTPPVSAPSNVTVPSTAVASLTLVKTADVSSVGAAGQVIVYSFTVTNTGATALTGLSISETSFTGSAALPAPSCPSTTLAPGGSAVCTTRYTVTTADLTASAIRNTAVAAARGPGGSTLDSAPSTADVAVAAVTVAPEVPGGDLAATGFDALGWLVGDATLLLAGLALVLAARRRPRRR